MQLGNVLKLAFKTTASPFVKAEVPPHDACTVNNIAHTVWIELAAEYFYRWNTQKEQ